MAIASNNPWRKTPIINDQYLGILKVRPVPKSKNDKVYVIESIYHLRPDLLAYDLYNDHNLWWVFTQRNMDVLMDPIYDFTQGTEIYLPDKNKLREVLS